LLFGDPSKEDASPILTETIKGEKAQAPVDLGRYCYTSQTNKAASVIKKKSSKQISDACTKGEERNIQKKNQTYLSDNLFCIRT
jgi:hypothetical protein